jgi:flagellar biosynthesis chaperone FliJ
MDKKRLIKYEKILHVQERQLDLIKQQIGTQRFLIAQLIQRREELQRQQFEIGTGVNLTADAASLMQQCSLVLLDLQQEINRVKTEIANADEKLDHFLRAFRSANQKLKSWEKLVEQESGRVVSAELLKEMHVADERYLATRFAGVKR